MGSIASKVRNVLSSPYEKTELPNNPDTTSPACDGLQTASLTNTGLKHNRKYLIKKYDPRSPTLEFERTPINVISETGESTMKRLQLCDMFPEMTPVLSKKKTLDASTATENAIESNLLQKHCDKSRLLTTLHYEKGNEEYNDAEGQETRDIDKFVVPEKVQLNKESMEEKFDDNKISPVAGLPQKVIKKIPKELSIYEDVSTSTLYDTPKKLIFTNESVSRTPLSCMKNKAEILYDPNSQNPNKMSKKLSYISRLKLHSKKTKAMPKDDSALKIVNKASVLSSNCENTPPNSSL